MADHWRLATMEGLSRTKNDGFEDFTIVCGKDQIKIHSMLLSLHSPVFEKMCRGRFKEAQEKVIELHDDAFDALVAMINWLYTSTWTCPENGTSELEFAVAMRIISDKYDVKHLKEMAMEKFKSHIHTASNDALICAAILAYDALLPTEEIRPMLIDRIVSCEGWEPGPHLDSLTSGSNLLAWDLVAATKKKCDQNVKVEKDRADRSIAAEKANAERLVREEKDKAIRAANEEKDAAIRAAREEKNQAIQAMELLVREEKARSIRSLNQEIEKAEKRAGEEKNEVDHIVVKAIDEVRRKAQQEREATDQALKQERAKVVALQTQNAALEKKKAVEDKLREARTTFSCRACDMKVHVQMEVPASGRLVSGTADASTAPKCPNYACGSRGRRMQA